MTSPLPLPDWVPWWVHLAILMAGLLFVLLFLMMPFSVFGTKPRLDAIEARLDEIQGEIRSLALRLPESLPAAPDDAEDYRPLRPPIPPAPRRADPRIVRPAGRTEPRLY